MLTKENGLLAAQRPEQQSLNWFAHLDGYHQEPILHPSGKAAWQQGRCMKKKPRRNWRSILAFMAEIFKSPMGVHIARNWRRKRRRTGILFGGSVNIAYRG